MNLKERLIKLNKIETDYNYQITTSGRSYSRTFFQNRIKQAYRSGKEEGFRDKDNLIKYLEDMIKHTTKTAHLPELYDDCTDEIQQNMWWVVKTRKDILERVKSGKYD